MTKEALQTSDGNIFIDLKPSIEELPIDTVCISFKEENPSVIEKKKALTILIQIFN